MPSIVWLSCYESTYAFMLFCLFVCCCFGPRRMRDLSSLTRDQTRVPLQWKCGALTTGPPGNSPQMLLRGRWFASLAPWQVTGIITYSCEYLFSFWLFYSEQIIIWLRSWRYNCVPAPRKDQFVPSSGRGLLGISYKIIYKYIIISIHIYVPIYIIYTYIHTHACTVIFYLAALIPFASFNVFIFLIIAFFSMVLDEAILFLLFALCLQIYL